MKKRRLADLVGIMAGFLVGTTLLGIDVNEQTTERIFDITGTALLAFSFILLAAWVLRLIPQREAPSRQRANMRNRWIAVGVLLLVGLAVGAAMYSMQ